MRLKTKKLQVILFVLIILIFNISNIVQAEIDPYSYSLVIGRAENVKGEVVIDYKNGNRVKINNNDTISTENIITFSLIYNDNAITLVDGSKVIEDELNIKTGPDGGMKIILNDLENYESHLVLGKDTEITIKPRGGCLYTTEFDGEGYDRDTLQWRHINPQLILKVAQGTLRIYYRPNGKLRLFSPSTPNADIEISEHEISGYTDYEVQVLTGEAAQQEEVSFGGLGYDVEDKIQEHIQNHLILYKVDSIDELDEDIKEQLMANIEILKESYAEAVESMKEMNVPPMVSNVVTILKVYEGEVSMEKTAVKKGELVKVKGINGLPGKVQQF